MGKRILGLDLGPNSIGWALVDVEEKRIVDLGVRVFPEGVDNFDTQKEKSRNEDRRIARGMRRQIRRRALRKRKLRNALIHTGLFPAEPEEQAKFYQMNPYRLRARALDERLTPYEIGRVLLHLSQRRGFKSNKKEEAKAEAKAKRKKTERKPKPDTEKKTEDILLEMAELERAIKQSNARTLGEYLYRKEQSFSHANRMEDDHMRGRHTLRKMLIDEFDLIWRKQSGYHGELLTEQLAYGKLGKQKEIHRPIPKWSDERKGLNDLESFGLFGIIFFHRTLKPVPKDIVGLCELEPKQRRCPRAHRRAQRFRLLQEINNLRFIDPDLGEECQLDDSQRSMLLEYMATREKATFGDLRKKLGFMETVQFNLERGKRSGIKGMEVDWLMAKSIGKQWHKLPDETKNGVVEVLVHSLDDDETYEQLTHQFGFSCEQAEAALGVDLPDGYLKFSLIAIEKLLPHMELGLVYEHSDPTMSARAQANYDEPWSLQKRIFDKLPDPRRTNNSPIGDIPNPVVKRTLVELRKLVNAILREYGRPNEIHVEMGRDVKTRPKNKRSPAYWKYKQEEDERAERESKRTAAKEKLREMGLSYGAGGRNILKYLLWEEQKGACAYSYPTRNIGINQLFTDQVQIDHILPVPGIDDSPMNKVVCFQSENHGATGKGHRTPRQWLEHARPDKWMEVCQRAMKLPYAKYKRFLRKDFKIDDFIERQLNDTRYIAKATVEYLKCLFNLKENKSGALLGVKGQQTSALRRLWGLDTILAELLDSPAWREEANLRPGEKNRADHRHHAIDAVVIALTDRNRLQELASGFTVAEAVDCETGEVKPKTTYRGKAIDVPWDTFRDDVQTRIEQVNVSHRIERKIVGPLHDDQPFGPTYSADGSSNSSTWVKRKKIEDLSASEVLDIRDSSGNRRKLGIRELVLKKLQDSGIEVRTIQPKRGKPKTLFVDLQTGEKAQDKASKKSLSEVTMPSGVPVKKVRLLVRNDTIKKVRDGKAEKSDDESQIAYVKPNATHHLCIFEWKRNGQAFRDAAFVTQLQAKNRIKQQKQELARRVKDWEEQGMTKGAIRDHIPAAMREIAHQYPIIDRDAKNLESEDRERIPDDAKFVMSLSKNELLLLEANGEDRLYIFNTAASTTRQMTFYPHTAAKRDGKQFGKLTKYPNSLFKLNPRKVTVDPLGRIRWAND